MLLGNYEEEQYPIMRNRGRNRDDRQGILNVMDQRMCRSREKAVSTDRPYWWNNTGEKKPSMILWACDGVDYDCTRRNQVMDSRGSKLQDRKPALVFLEYAHLLFRRCMIASDPGYRGAQHRRNRH